MKNKIFMLICAAFICGSVSAQKISTDKVPAPVTAAFKSKFPTVENATWKMAGGKNYEADFRLNNVGQTATFNSTGGWVSSSTEIKVSELPADVNATISKQFAGYTVGKASKTENAEHEMGYAVGIAKGSEMKNVVLSAKGVVISQEAAKSTMASTAKPTTTAKPATTQTASAKPATTMTKTATSAKTAQASKPAQTATKKPVTETTKKN